MQTRRFTSKALPVLSGYEARAILRSLKEGSACTLVSIDLGLTWRMASLEEGRVIIGDLEVNADIVEEIAQGPEDLVYAIAEGKVVKLTKYARGSFYKLKAIGRSNAPTLEISGIHMHRIKNVDPWEDSRLKVATARVRPGDRVLDTCMGLGYTASWSLLYGARSVVTVEVDPTVVEIATYNPWSRTLESPSIQVVAGDVTEAVEEFEDEQFDVIVHDPPRISLAGSLYGRRFYSELFRILKSGGRLYHYTGGPGRVKGVDLARGVMRRLEEVGFYVRRGPQGVLAYKD